MQCEFRVLNLVAIDAMEHSTQIRRQNLTCRRLPTASWPYQKHCLSIGNAPSSNNNTPGGGRFRLDLDPELWKEFDRYLSMSIKRRHRLEVIASGPSPPTPEEAAQALSEAPSSPPSLLSVPKSIWTICVRATSPLGGEYRDLHSRVNTIT